MGDKMIRHAIESSDKDILKLDHVIHFFGHMLKRLNEYLFNLLLTQ